MNNYIITPKLEDWGKMDPAEAKNMQSTQKQFEKEFGNDSSVININSDLDNTFTISLKTVIEKKLFDNSDIYSYKQFSCPCI